MKIAVVANTAWYVANFRLTLMDALRREGHEVVAISPPGQDVERIEARGFAHRAFPLDTGGIRPLRELAAVLKLRRVFRNEVPDLVLSYTPKGNIYSALARWGVQCLQVANVSGLGSSFIRQSWLTRFVWILYRSTFSRMHWVFFQNEDDRRMFLQAGLVDPTITDRIPGSGVDLQRFEMVPLPQDAETAGPTFLMIARLIADKGIHEYAEAARLLQKTCPGARFQLLGDRGTGNPGAISDSQLHAWANLGVIEYVGYHVDVRPFVRAASCVVLPSYYREGVPRSLLEGAAMGRPLISTDMPGCRDTIDEGLNGYLCRARDATSLAQAMIRIVRLSAEQRAAMGRFSRKKAEAEFSEHIVIDKYLKVIRAI